MNKPDSLWNWLPRFVLFATLGLSACIQPRIPPSPASTPLLPTPTGPEEVIQLATATSTPTAVRQIESASTPAPTPWKTSHDRTPAWLAAPGGADVALMNLCGRPEQCELVFVNSATKEDYILTVPGGANYYFWLPDTPSGPSGMKLGLVYLPDSLVIYRLANGAIEEMQFDPGALRYLADASSANALLPVFSYGNAGEKNWFLIPDTRAVSFDRRYVVRQDWNDPETPISVDDLGSGNSFQLTKAADGRYDVAYAWSPVEKVVAVLQSSEPPVPTAAGQVAFHDTHLLIYDVTGGSTEAGGGIRMASASWQSDGKQILFLSGTTPEINNLPCWLDLATGTTQCADAIPRAYPADYLSDLAWIPGENRIIFLRHSPTALTNQLCTYDLNSAETACKVEAGEGRKITSYRLAPDRKVVFFTHDTLGSSADAPEAPYAALASLDGSWIVDLAGKDVYDRFGWNPALLGVLWRPK